MAMVIIDTIVFTTLGAALVVGSFWLFVIEPRGSIHDNPKIG
jgi:hypothetical protein